MATILYNDIEFVMAFWAAHKLSCTFVPINPGTLIIAEEAAHMLRVAGVSIVLVQDIQTAIRFDALLGDAELNQKKIVISHTPFDSSWVTFASMMHADNVTSSTTDGGTTENEIVTVLFTSGTNSLPKGVPHTDTTLNTFCENLSLGGRSATSIFCSVLPNNHAMGYFYTLHFMMHGAAIVYPSPSFDANAMIKALQQSLRKIQQIGASAIIGAFRTVALSILESEAGIDSYTRRHEVQILKGMIDRGYNA